MFIVGLHWTEVLPAIYFMADRLWLETLIYSFKYDVLVKSLVYYRKYNSMDCAEVTDK